MLLLALLLQSATPPTAAAEALRPTDQALAIDTFRVLCWTNLREPEAFHDALPTAPLPLTPAPAADGAAAEVYRAPQAILTYLASDALAAGVPPRQCRLRVRLGGTVDQLALAARIGEALALPSGRTRTDPTGSTTTWDVAQPDGRIVRLIAATRNAVSGDSELRLSALLLAPR